MFRAWSCIVLVLLCCLNEIQSAVFLGGTMSSQILSYGNTTVKVKVAAQLGWQLGKGPCGVNCSSASIGMNTLATRKAMIQRHGEDYFGTWQIEIKDRESLLITKQVSSEMHETVIDVNENDGWELDRIVFTIDVPLSTSYVDIIFEGDTWLKTTLQPSVRTFHMQNKITMPRENDTHTIDSVPVVLMKPYFRLMRNRTYKISDFFCVKDDDGDYLKIRKTMYVEGGIQLSYHAFPGLELNNTNITISTSDLQSNSTGIIGLIVQAIPVEFVVEIVDSDPSPKFVSPYNQRYRLFNGASFNATFTATSSNMLRNISKFYFILDGMPFTKISNITYSTTYASTTVMWTPRGSDDHLLCVSVEDNKRSRSSLMNCHTILTSNFETDQLTEDKILNSNSSLSFSNFPKFDSVVCEIGDICKFMVYATSKASGGILAITLKSSDTMSTTVVSNLKTISLHTKAIEVEFSDIHYGTKSICFEARTADTQIEKCVYVKVKANDPCASSPCGNYGTCVSLTYNRDFRCQCPFPFEGTFCEKVADLCHPNRCKNNSTCMQISVNVFCLCTPTTTGQFCDQDPLNPDIGLG